MDAFALTRGQCEPGARLKALGIVLALTLAALLVLTVPALGAKKGGGGKVKVARTLNAPIPDGGPVGGLDGVLTSSVRLGKRYAGLRIRDVNVTVQTLGVTGVNPVGELQARLVAPSGSNVRLFTNLTTFMIPTASLGPLTLDDEARLDLGQGSPEDPTRLYGPWAGSAAPEGQLWTLDGGPVRGTWALDLSDCCPNDISNLVAWRLTVLTGPRRGAK
jgi:hypothetical protein